MKVGKELRNWINRMRSREGKKNGVVKYLFESRTALKFETDKRVKIGRSERTDDRRCDVD